ncbi:hypothetical protein AWZ03_015160, partial [Drosophila navojoa]
PLNALLKKGTKWEWTEERQRAFETVKAKLTKSPVLACPDFSQLFCLQTDASNYGLGVILTQALEKWLNSIESPSGTIARWARELQQYDFEIRYRKGKQIIVADALSRQSLGEETCRLVKSKEIPAGTGCRWLSKLRQDLKRAPHKFQPLWWRLETYIGTSHIKPAKRMWLHRSWACLLSTA